MEICVPWSEGIGSKLLGGAVDCLNRHDAADDKIDTLWVPGAYEIPLVAKKVAESGKYDAVICLGAVIRGETPHFDYICQGVRQGATLLNLKYNKPFIFGVLTTNNLQQAKDRAGGKCGNKGDEAAIAAIKMIHLKNSFSK